MTSTPINPLTPSIAATTPSCATLAFITRRWEYWGAWCLMAYRLPSQAPDFRERHYFRVLSLIHAGIRPDVIRKRDLDDPRPTDAEWTERIRRYWVERDAGRRGMVIATAKSKGSQS